MEKDTRTAITSEGMEKLKTELEQLKTVRRREVADKIKVALSFGDLSENSEYDEAKNEQAMVEARIAQIEQRIKNAKVVKTNEIEKDIVGIGSVLKVYDSELKETIEYKIVGLTEADPLNGKISGESPVGKALLGHKKGDEVVAITPSGNMMYKIEEIL